MVDGEEDKTMNGVAVCPNSDSSTTCECRRRDQGGGGGGGGLTQ